MLENNYIIKPWTKYQTSEQYKITRKIYRDKNKEKIKEYTRKYYFEKTKKKYIKKGRCKKEVKKKDLVIYTPIVISFN
jgi:hypothetical protein